MKRNILITGGAGFIGSHLADELLAAGYNVRVLDCLLPQVHGSLSPGPGSNGRNGSRPGPAYLSRQVELQVGDVRDPGAVRRALEGIDAVYHFAARVGVGQSMYEIRNYVDTNNTGTAVLLEALVEQPVERLIVASSMSIYGEGLYRAPDGTVHHNVERSPDQLRAGQWEPHIEGRPLHPVATPETKAPRLASVYALSKFDQERVCLISGSAYGIPTVALRFFNVYGTRQALSNPYTGVLAIFASRLLNGKAPLIFEDGRQKRDFVNVKDVARACRLALENDAAAGRVFNIGSGRSYTVREIAASLASVLGREELTPEITGKYRAGDIRHCFSDISRARRLLGYEPRVSLVDGLSELSDWLAGQVAHDRFEEMAAELKSRGLTI